MKKKKIIEVAMICFNSKGIVETSIDEIVKQCKISKATFYKNFKSKEDLIGYMLISLKEEFENNISTIGLSNEMSKREALVIKILKTIEFINSSIPFYTQVIDGFSRINGENTMDIRRSIRVTIVNEYYKSIVDVYGKNSRSWDLVFIVDSFVHQFNFIHKINGYSLNRELHGEYILTVLDLMNEGFEGKNSFVSEDIFFSDHKGVEPKSVRDELLDSIRELRVNGNNLGDKIQEAIGIIEKEVKESRVNSVTFEGMLMYINNEVSLQKHVKKIKEIISRM